ncbi:MAG TPA: hypothetical protein VI076_08590 [Actinopolymorphaceae bacterium]
MTSTYATKAYVDERLAPLEERVHDLAKQLEGHGFMLNRVLTEQSTIKEYLEEVLKRHGALTRAVDRQGALLEQHTARLDGIDGRLDGIDGRLDAVDGRLDRLEAGQERAGVLLEQILDRLPPPPALPVN